MQIIALCSMCFLRFVPDPVKQQYLLLSGLHLQGFTASKTA